MQPEARGRDFNDFEIGPLGHLQPLGLTPRKGKLNSSVQLYHDAIVSGIVYPGVRPRISLALNAGYEGTLVTSHIPGTNWLVK